MIEPTVTRHGSSFAFTWPGCLIKIVLSRFHVSSRATDAELQVSVVNGSETGLITSAKINLQSLPTRKKFAQELADRVPGVSMDWATMVEQVCILGLRAHREGEPFILLQPNEQANVPFLLNPLVYENHQTLIYAPGGSCKSYLALYLALLVLHGAEQNDLAAIRGPVLYLDWELDADTTGTRLRRIQRGHPELSKELVVYRRCLMALHEESDLIAAEVAQKGIKLAIIDSAIMACGDDLNGTQAPKQLQRALRQMGCASIVLSHVAKNSEEKTAYGNVFFQNLCRNQYEVQLVDRSREYARITLAHRKNNFGSFQLLRGLHFDFTNDACRVSGFDPEQAGECQDSLPIPSRIRNLLEDGTPRSAKEVAEDLGLKLATVKAILSKHRGIKWHMTGEGREAKWTALNR